MRTNTPNTGEILLYQTADGLAKIEVTLINETVWLTIDQMATLFQRNKSTLSRHIRDAFECGELNPDSVVAFFATTAADGKNYNVSYYNLDMIISVGYRVHSLRGVQFRMWATRTLKEYLIKSPDITKMDELSIMNILFMEVERIIHIMKTETGKKKENIRMIF